MTLNIKSKITLIAAVFLAAMMTAGCCCCYPGAGSGDDGPGPITTTPTNKPVYTPTPKPTPTPSVAGFSRTNPAPIGTPVEFKASSIPGSKLRITLLEVQRGNMAYGMIEDSDGYTYLIPPEPDPEQEYLIAKFKVEFLDHTSNSPEDYYVSYSDFICRTPDNTREYTYEWFTYMEPRISEQLFKGDSTEGWVTFEVKQGLDYLISFENGKIWFSV